MNRQQGLRVDLLRPGRPKVAACAAALALVIVACIAVGWGWKLARDSKLLEASLVAARSGEALAPGPRVDELALPPPVYALSAQEMLRQQSFAWPDALRALEAVAMVGVTPSVVELSASEGAARVELVVSDPTALADYIAQLNAGMDAAEPNLWRWDLQQLQRAPGGQQTATLRARAVGSSIHDRSR